MPRAVSQNTTIAPAVQRTSLPGPAITWRRFSSLPPNPALFQREHGAALSELSERMIAAADEVEEKRGELFRLLHPRREELERERAAAATA